MPGTGEDDGKGVERGRLMSLCTVGRQQGKLVQRLQCSHSVGDRERRNLHRLGKGRMFNTRLEEKRDLGLLLEGSIWF